MSEFTQTMAATQTNVSHENKSRQNSDSCTSIQVLSEK